MKNKDIISTIYGLTEIMVQQEEEIKKDPGIKRIPIKIAYGISKNKKMLEEENKTFVDELRKLNNEYGLDFDEKGNISLVGLDNDKRVEYANKLTELQNIDVNVNIHRVSVDDFGEYTPSIKQLDILSFMLD